MKVKKFDFLSKTNVKELDEDTQSFLTRFEGEITGYITGVVSELQEETTEKLLKIRGQMEKSAGTFCGINPTDRLIREKSSDLKSLKNNKYEQVMINMKASDTITRLDNISPQPNSYLPAPYLVPGVHAIVHPSTRILNYINYVSIDNPIVAIVNETAGTGDFGWTAEAEKKPQTSFGFATQTCEARKLAVYAKISREMLTDIKFIQAETVRILTGKYLRRVAESVYSGDGSGESIFGLKHFAPMYTQTLLNGKMQTPGLSEVLFAAATQIRNNGFEGQLTAIVNPCDWATEKARKKTDGELLELTRLLDGIAVVETMLAPPDSFFVGDLSTYTLYVYDDFNIVYGYENDDFTRNLVSIVAEGRVYGFVSDNHKGAFVADSIDSVVALIAK